MADYFNQWMFTSSETSFVCPGWLFGQYKWICAAPAACATDPGTRKQYCCNADDVCWTASSVCAGDGTTFVCDFGSDSWCCVKNREHCTTLPGQINICYSLAHDTLTNISSSVLNDTYSSLSSAEPTASSYTFDPLALIAQTQSSSPTSAGPSKSPTESSSDSTANSSTDSTHETMSLSGGAIAGIVVGVVLALALVSIAAFLLLRRRKRTKQKNDMPTKHIYTAPQSYSGKPTALHQELDVTTAPVSELQGAPRYPGPYELPTKLHNDS